MNTLSYNANAMISLPVNDLDKSVRWYSEMLDLNVTQRLDDPPWCELATNVNGLSVGLAEVTKVKVGDSMLSLGVADVTAARATLLERGADVSDVVEVDGVAKVITLLDIDGNAIMLRENS